MLLLPELIFTVVFRELVARLEDPTWSSTTLAVGADCPQGRLGSPPCGSSSFHIQDCLSYGEVYKLYFKRMKKETEGFLWPSYGDHLILLTQYSISLNKQDQSKFKE